MEKRLLQFLEYCEKLDFDNLDAESKKKELDNLMIQIQFFSHERLVHLIVTVTFALLTLIALFITLTVETIATLILCIGFLVLLVPYVRHYYILENGVQKLYTIYDKLRE